MDANLYSERSFIPFELAEGRNCGNLIFIQLERRVLLIFTIK